jgi:hypothetical protein
MSLVDDQIREANSKHQEEVHNCHVEHLLFLEKQRIDSENAVQNSAKGNWERLRAKRSKPQVLRRLPLSH